MLRPMMFAATLLCASAAVGQDTEEPPEVTEIREQVPGIMKELEELRGKKFKKAVAVKYQSEDDFKAWMQEQVDEQYPEERAVRDVKLLSAVGLLEAGFDLRKCVIDAMAGQAMAYYDPAQGTFFVLKPHMQPEMTRVYVLHELQHALQDQTYDLKTKMARFEGPGFDREDEAVAFKFVMEGEATYLMLKYALEQAGQGGMLEMQLQMMGTSSREQMAKMEKMQAQMTNDKATMETLAQRDALPNYIYNQLIDPYNKGAWFCYQLVKNNGGHVALDELFENIPQSSEQVLHPEKCLGADRDEPVVLELPDLSEQVGAKLIAKNTLGELNLRTMFQELTNDPKVKACAGWDGDRIHAYASGEQEWASIVWLTTWDSEQDAKEFAAALDELKAKGPPPLASADVSVHGKDVLIVGNVDEEKLEAVKAAALEGATR